MLKVSAIGDMMTAEDLLEGARKIGIDPDTIEQLEAWRASNTAPAALLTGSVQDVRHAGRRMHEAVHIETPAEREARDNGRSWWEQLRGALGGKPMPGLAMLAAREDAVLVLNVPQNLRNNSDYMASLQDVAAALPMPVLILASSIETLLVDDDETLAVALDALLERGLERALRQQGHIEKDSQVVTVKHLTRVARVLREDLRQGVDRMVQARDLVRLLHEHHGDEMRRRWLLGNLAAIFGLATVHDRDLYDAEVEDFVQQIREATNGIEGWQPPIRELGEEDP